MFYHRDQWISKCTYTKRYTTGLKCNVTYVSRGLCFILYIFLSLVVGEERAFASLWTDREAEDGRGRLRLSVIPWNRTCYTVNWRACICDRLEGQSGAIAICDRPSGPYAGLIRALITGTSPLRYVGTVTKYFSSSTVALGARPWYRDACVRNRWLILTKIDFISLYMALEYFKDSYYN